VVSTEPGQGLILVRGAIPGADGGWVRISDAVKRALPKEAPFPAGLFAGAAAEAAPDPAAPEPAADETATPNEGGAPAAEAPAEDKKD